MNYRRVRAGMLLGFLGLLGAMSQQTARADLLAVTFDSQLIRINTTTGVGALVGPLGAGGLFPIGLAFRGDELYTYAAGTDELVQINPSDGTQNGGGIDIGLAETPIEGALSFRGDGVGFLSSAAPGGSQLFRFNISPPSSTAITDPGDFLPPMDGLAFDRADVLYGLSQGTTDTNGTSLYTIETTKGTTTLVGSLGVGSDFLLGGLTFDSDGSLYAALSQGSGLPSYLYKVNKSTGQATLVGNGIGFDGVSGLAAQQQNPIPEPSSLVLASLGVAGLVGFQFRRRRCRGWSVSRRL